MSTQTVETVNPAGPPASRMVPVDAIVASPLNPRKIFDKKELEALTDSVRQHGVLQPILVRPNPKAAQPPFELVAGERRWRASKAARCPQIPAMVRDLSDVEVIEIQLVENKQRNDLHPLEEAAGYKALITRGKYDVAKIAARTGRSAKYVYDRVKLLTLTKDAQAAFLDGRFEAGHAILLARLKPEDQKRAMDRGALYDHEHLAFGAPDENEGFTKPVTVREFSQWIDQHVRFETDKIDEMLFPETHKALRDAAETKTKVIPITHEYQVAPDAKGAERILGYRSWKRADGKEGSKGCPRSVTGVLVAGENRGEVLDVCINKDHCDIHWGTERRAKVKAKKKADKAPDPKVAEQNRKKAQEREEAERKRWEKAAPALLKALAEKVKKAPAGGRGLLAEIIVKAVTPFGGPGLAPQLLPRGTTSEQLVRHAAFLVIAAEARGYLAREVFPKRAKAFGIDAKKIVNEVAPPPKPEPKAKKKKAAGPLARKKAAKPAAKKKTAKKKARRG